MEEQEKLTAIPSQLSGPGRSDCFGERSQLFGTSLPQLCPEAGAGQAQHLLCITEGVATCVLVVSCYFSCSEIQSSVGGSSKEKPK